MDILSDEYIFLKVVFVLILLFILFSWICSKLSPENIVYFPFKVENIVRFHSLVDEKIVPMINKANEFNCNIYYVKDICQRDYEINDKVMLRFCYTGQVFVLYNQQEYLMGVLKNIKSVRPVSQKINDFLENKVLE